MKNLPRAIETAIDLPDEGQVCGIIERPAERGEVGLVFEVFDFEFAAVPVKIGREVMALGRQARFLARAGERGAGEDLHVEAARKSLDERVGRVIEGAG